MSDTAVSAKDVVLGYGAHIAVDRSSFTIPRPGITAIIGPNGSGKSTILNAIAGLLTPLSGTIEVAGGRGVSYVLQTTKVNDHLPVTVEEVVTMGRYSSAGWFSRLATEDRDRVRVADRERRARRDAQHTAVEALRARHTEPRRATSGEGAIEPQGGTG